MSKAEEDLTNGGFKTFDRDYWKRLLRTSIIFFIGVAKVHWCN